MKKDEERKAQIFHELILQIFIFSFSEVIIKEGLIRRFEKFKD